MSIYSSSDLVFDVAQAVDPAQYRASMEKLRNLRTTISKSTVQQPQPDKQFSTILVEKTKRSVPSSQTSPSSSSHNDGSVSSYATNLPESSSVGERDSRSKLDDVNQQFEAFMLQSLVQNMFTTDTPSVFGKGQSGELWKSMLVEMVAKKMAQAGGIGIASLLAGKQNNQELDSSLKFNKSLSSLTINNLHHHSKIF